MLLQREPRARVRTYVSRRLPGLVLPVSFDICLRDASSCTFDRACRPRSGGAAPAARRNVSRCVEYGGDRLHDGGVVDGGGAAAGGDSACAARSCTRFRAGTFRRRGWLLRPPALVPVFRGLSDRTRDRALGTAPAHRALDSRDCGRQARALDRRGDAGHGIPEPLDQQYRIGHRDAAHRRLADPWTARRRCVLDRADAGRRICSHDRRHGFADRHPPNALFAAYVGQTYGRDIGFAQWAAVGLPVAGFLLGLAWIVLVRLTPGVRHSGSTGAAVKSPCTWTH